MTKRNYILLNVLIAIVVLVLAVWLLPRITGIDHPHFKIGIVILFLAIYAHAAITSFRNR